MGMPFEQGEAAETPFVPLQDRRQPREFVKLRAAAAVFPVADALWLDAQFGGDGGLFQSQLNSALPEELA